MQRNSELRDLSAISLSFYHLWKNMMTFIIVQSKELTLALLISFHFEYVFLLMKTFQAKVFNADLTFLPWNLFCPCIPLSQTYFYGRHWSKIYHQISTKVFNHIEVFSLKNKLFKAYVGLQISIASHVSDWRVVARHLRALNQSNPFLKSCSFLHEKTNKIVWLRFCCTNQIQKQTADKMECFSFVLSRCVFTTLRVTGLTIFWDITLNQY